jgi:uncharacterized Zn-finger protein
MESNLDGMGENKSLPSVSVTASMPSTGTKRTCSVILVDIGPKISASGSYNMHSGNATGNSLKQVLLSSSGFSGGELKIAASVASIVKAASSVPSLNVATCTDKPNAKKPRQSLSKSSTATVHRISIERNQRKNLQKYHYCQSCDAKYRDARSLKYHVESVHEGKEPYKCNICNRDFSGENNLKNHISTVHEDNKPFNCVICHLRFPSKATVSAHIAKIHEGKRSFKCEKCEATFKNSSHLTRHVNSVHERKKLFNCSDCEKQFSEKADLGRHIESVHEGKRPHKCNVCGKSFTEKKFMLKHIDSVHEGNKPFKCDKCERTFAHKGNMKKHILQGISYQLLHIYNY